MTMRHVESGLGASIPQNNNTSHMIAVNNISPKLYSKILLYGLKMMTCGGNKLAVRRAVHSY